MANVYLVNLPVELLYCIFDHLDVNTILRLLRPVCKLFYDVIVTYRKFKLNFTSMSESDVRFVARLIQPDCISSITFSDTDRRRLDEINLFLSFFNIRQLSQLKSLTFGQTAIQSRQTLAILPSAVDESILFPLRLSNLDYLVQHIFRPIQNMLQHLAIHICTYYQYRIVLRCSPSLRTFVVEYCDVNDNNATVDSSSPEERHPQLKSLTIHNCRLPIEYLRLCLILTPSLVYLKLVSPKVVYGPVFDGSFWEHLIRIRLPQLKKFEFFFVYPVRRNAPVHSVKSIIATFQTPFWINDKHWLATCDYVVKSSQITLYTIPIGMNDCEILVRCEALPMNSVCHLIRHQTNEKDDIAAKETLTMLNLKGYPIGEQGAQYLADALSNDVTLNTLNLQRTHIGDEGLKQLTYALRKSTVLTTLYLENNQIGTFGAQYLAELLRTNSTLLALHLPLNQITDKAAQYLADGLRDNTTLTTLNLRFNRIGDSEVQHLAMALEKNTALTTLDVGGNNFGPLGVQFIANALTRNTTLTTLDVGGNNLEALGVQLLADALTRNTTLTTLKLRFSQIGNSEAQHLAMALEKNTALTTLDVGGNNFGPLGVQFIANALTRNTTLTTLVLEGNNLGAKGAQYLANVLPKITTLTTLNLSHNLIWDKGAQFVADALPYKTSLITLDLVGNDIEEPGAQYLADKLRNNTRLIKLNLSRNPISKETMQLIDELLQKSSHMKNSN